jgi:hypothetical protein
VFCNSCGADIPNAARFCSMCGDSFLAWPKHSRKMVRRRWAPLGFAAAGLLLVSGLGYFAYLNHHMQGVSANSAIGLLERRYDLLTKKPHSIPLSTDGLTINQLGYSYFKIEIPAKASSVLLHGKFTASGGGGNTIEAFVFSEDSYLSWQEQHDADSFYKSGRVSMDTIVANLPSGPGTYYLVFNNKFSPTTPKTIRMDAKVTYYQ